MPRDGTENARGATRARREGATRTTKSISKAPPRASIGPETVRSEGAKILTKPRGRAPPREPIGKAATPARRKAASERAAPTGESPPSDVIKRLRELQSIRKHCIKSQSRIDRSMESLIASALGYRPDLPTKDGKAIFRQAATIRLSVEKGGEGYHQRETQNQHALSAILHLIPVSAASRDLWDKRRAEVERDMEKLAQELPAWASFAKGVRGLGPKGFGIICAEASIPIGEYRTISGLWKRLGLAVISGERQQRKRGAAAIEHGYSPRRRSEVWAVCSDSLFRAQWRGDKDEDGADPTKTGKPVAEPAHAIGPYGEAYARRRAHTAPRVEMTADLDVADPAKWTKGRCHNDGRRIMTKALMADLWVAWREADRHCAGTPPVAEASSGGSTIVIGSEM